MNILLLLLVFFVGASLASFFGQCFFRQKLSTKSQKKRRSFCDHCKKTLSPLALIPVIGYLLQKGKCQHCQATIPWKYPLMESLNGLLLCGLILQFSLQESASFLSLFALLTFFESFFFAAWQDQEEQLVSLSLIGLLVLSTLIYIANTGISPEQLLGAAVGIFVTITTYFLSKKQLGEADILLITIIGLMLGWQGLVLSLFLSCTLAIMVMFLKRVLMKRSFSQLKKEPFALVPFLLLGTLSTWLLINTTSFIS